VFLIFKCGHGNVCDRIAGYETRILSEMKLLKLTTSVEALRMLLKIQAFSYRFLDTKKVQKYVLCLEINLH
jgi:hypothetical protein